MTKKAVVKGKFYIYVHRCKSSTITHPLTFLSYFEKTMSNRLAYLAKPAGLWYSQHGRGRALAVKIRAAYGPAQSNTETSGAPDCGPPQGQGVKGKQVRILHELVTVIGEYKAKREKRSHCRKAGRPLYVMIRQPGNLPVRLVQGLSAGPRPRGNWSYRYRRCRSEQSFEMTGSMLVLPFVLVGQKAFFVPSIPRSPRFKKAVSKEEYLS